MKDARNSRAIEAFTPSRLILARQRRGFTKKELAAAAGLGTTSISLLENGKQQPTEATLARLADALSFPVEFLTAPEPETLPEGTASFRALSTLSIRRQNSALAAGTLAIELYRWVDSHFSLPVPDIPCEPGVDPEMAAQAVRAAWGLGQRPIANMIHLLEAHGVRVFSLAEDSLAVDAFSFRVDGIPFVLLNTMKTAERSRMDAAHELGHLVLHAGHDTPRGREVEQEARQFASAFLMPRASVLADAPRNGSVKQLVAAKRRWNVAVTALAYRMHDLGMLTDWQYRSVFMTYGRSDEPEPGSRESSQVLDKVFKALRADGVSRVDVARALCLPKDELNKLVFGLVPTLLPGSGSGERNHGEDRPSLRLIRNDPMLD